MLEGKVAIITGSSKGIGKSIAHLFLRAGAKVFICGSNDEHVEKTISEFIKLGFKSENILGMGFNINDSIKIKECVDKVMTSWGKIDILVNNAGVTSNESLLDSTDESFEYIYNINLFGVVKMTREVVKHMKKNGGSIINTSSMVGINGGKNQSAYASSKFAVNGLTISWAKELGEYNIRVNAVAPGVVETDMMKNAVTPEMKNILVNMTPLKRMANPSDISGVYLYLASDMSTFTTGAIIKVDGGLIM